MYCKSVAVKNFRNIKEARVEFSRGVNILCGENAQGKTNLIEAVFYASLCRSFRAANSSEMIMFGEQSAEISLDYLCSDKQRADNISVKLFCDRKKTVEKNNLRVDKISDIIGSFRTVLFCPEHLSLVKGGPSERRSYLDIAISRISPKYIRLLQSYGRCLKERNMLIKSAYSDRRAFDATAELWSEKLAQLSSEIAEMRVDYLRRASALVERYFDEMTENSPYKKEKVELIYKGSAGLIEGDYFNREETADRYYKLLTSSYDKEIAFGSTLYGIHKDDIEIKINGRSARTYASQGQKRSVALGMKLAEGEICKEDMGDDPVFLFDDVLSELDDTRRDYLILNATEKQVIITTCEREFTERINADRYITVRDGTYNAVNNSEGGRV